MGDLDGAGTWSERALDALEDPVVTLEPIRDGSGEIVDFVYRQANAAACTYNGIPREDLVGARVLDLFPGLLAAGMLQDYIDVLDTGEPRTLADHSYNNELRDYEPLRYDVRIVRAGDAVVITWRDVTERFVANREITAEAHTDFLTGLVSRSQGISMLRRALGEDQREGRGLAVAYLDVDGLKDVNDRLGHAAGDALIQAVGVRIRAAVRDSDTVIRHGGDEIVVLLRGIDSLTAAEAVCRKILDAVALPIALDGSPVATTASIGVTLARADDSPPSIVARADDAMYEAKRTGGNAVVAV